ncbi:mitochondrial carrier domain-containing protein [Syncephalis plumigaleata]|nr:mitochondrial carrier domain-containing protein [Syncephalis plumigaleata]
MIGSLSGTMIYFGFYEWTKRNLIGQGTPDSIAHLTAGAFGDFMASFIFVPSEVLKTRMQLQGRYNNPHFVSGYNYHNFLHAFRTIVSTEGPMTLYHGYKATLLRDAPFSALQFAFYERLKVLAMDWHATDVQHATKIADSGLPATTELIVGAVAGGAAGGLTTPLDVIKTMLQTQQEEKPKRQRSSAPAHAATNLQYRYITGVNDGLRQIWRQEGIPGLFRGFTPRICITSLQSAIMFFIYERILARIMHMKSMYASSSTSPSSSSSLS